MGDCAFLASNILKMLKIPAASQQSLTGTLSTNVHSCAYLRLTSHLIKVLTEQVPPNPINTNQFSTKIETRPPVKSLSLCLRTSCPLSLLPFKAKAQGKGGGAAQSR